MEETRRSDYRERLLALRARLTEEAQEAIERVADRVRKPNELSHVPSHPADRDSEGLDREVTLEANREQTIAAIDRALARMGEGEYGRCEECGREIAEDRLQALPFAELCVGCEEKRAQG